MALNGNTWRAGAFIAFAALLISLGAHAAAIFGTAGALTEKVAHNEMALGEHVKDRERHETPDTKTARIRSEITLAQKPILDRLDTLEDAVRELTRELKNGRD